MKSTSNHEVNKNPRSYHCLQGLLFLKLVHQRPLVHCIHEGGYDHAHVVILQHLVPPNYLGVISPNCL